MSAGARVFVGRISLPPRPTDTTPFRANSDRRELADLRHVIERADVFETPPARRRPTFAQWPLAGQRKGEEAPTASPCRNIVPEDGGCPFEVGLPDRHREIEAVARVYVRLLEFVDYGFAFSATLPTWRLRCRRVPWHHGCRRLVSHKKKRRRKIARSRSTKE